MKNVNWIIVGGGAAGLSAAITLARSGAQVLLLEQNSRIAKKLLATGNGRCNLTNQVITPAHFHSRNRGFVEQVLSGYGVSVVEKFFGEMGVPLLEGKDGQMFPMSLQASTVVDILEYSARHLGVSIQTEVTIAHIIRDKRGFVLRSGDQIWHADQLMLATGSPAAPQLGGDTSGLELARSLGHTIHPPYPTLVQLESDAPWLKRVAGVKLNGIVHLYANGELIDQQRGDLLFTPYGISGLAILDISHAASLALKEGAWCELRLNLMPSFTKEQLIQLLLSHISPASNKPITLWLSAILNKKLVPILLKQAKCTATKERELRRKQINRLVHNIQNFAMPITGTHGFRHAEAAAGGVDVDEVDPVTMASRIVSGLYFGGEILDVVGDRGGYNLQWAWTTGIRAGRNR